MDKLGIDKGVHLFLRDRVSTFQANGNWILTSDFISAFTEVAREILKVVFCNDDDVDVEGLC